MVTHIFTASSTVTENDSRLIVKFDQNEESSSLLALAKHASLSIGQIVSLLYQKLLDKETSQRQIVLVSSQSYLRQKN